jgi:hypothetical protein
VPKGQKRSDKEWITILTGRRVDESKGAFSKRVGIPYTYLSVLLKRYPEVTRLPAYADHAGKLEPRAAKIKGVRVLKPRLPKVVLAPGEKRRGRPPGSKNKPSGRAPKAVPADPARSNFKPIASKSAEEIFYQDLSIALKSGRRLRIELQLMPEGQ